MKPIQGSLFETAHDDGGVQPVIDSSANVTKGKFGAKIPAAPRLQSAIKKEAAELLEICSKRDSAQ